MKRFLFLLIGIMMAGGMAVAEAAPPIVGNVVVEAIIPAESTAVVPSIEKPVELSFDLEGVEVSALDDVQGEGIGAWFFAALVAGLAYECVNDLSSRTSGKPLYETLKDAPNTLRAQAKADREGYDAYWERELENYSTAKNGRGRMGRTSWCEDNR